MREGLVGVLGFRDSFFSLVAQLSRSSSSVVRLPILSLQFALHSQQLADTGGSSIVPSSVNQGSGVLNNKACRRAVMFGDALSPECFLIVEELKQTSVCFQVSGK